MPGSYRLPTVGVEEEYQLVELPSGQLAPRCKPILKRASHGALAHLQHELHLEQIEMASPILTSTAEIRGCLLDTRRAISRAASQYDSALASAGTNPLPAPHTSHFTPVARYQDMAQRFQMLARELLIFGLHVHIDMPDRELGVQVMNHVRGWLPLLQAMSANSPYWNGEDTGYASYRRELWVQWPTSGIPLFFRDFEEHQQCMHTLINAGVIRDETHIYWDLRLPAKVATIEFRVFDAQTEVEDTLALVAVTRALVMRSELAVHRGEAAPPLLPQLLRAAMWQAARYGMSHRLIDPFAGLQVAATQHLDQLLAHVREPLDVLADTDRVMRFCQRLKTAGAPAERQRRVLQASADGLASVVRDVVTRTAAEAPLAD